MSEEALQIAEKRNERYRRKRKIYPTEFRVAENIISLILVLTIW